jgi:hypothetical protein
VRKHLPLTAVLLVAAIARCWAIDFCLPALLCRPDEEAVASIASGFFARDFNPHFFDWPPVFMYAVALSMVPYFKYEKFTGALRSEFKFLQSITSDPTPLFLSARLISAAAGTASAWVLYRIALRLFDRTTALVAAAFLALAYLHVRDSHFGVTDVGATFLVLLTVLMCARLATAFSIRDLVIAGILTGLAAATKYNAALVGLPALWIIATNPMRRSIAQLIGTVCCYCTIAATVFLAVSPYSLIEYTAFLHSLNGVSTHLMGGHGPDVGRGWWVHLTSSLGYGVGLPMLVAGIAGMIWMMSRSPRIGVMLALFPAATYLIIGSGLTVFARYALPIVPFLCLTAAYAVVESSRALAIRLERPQWQASFAYAAALLILAPSAQSVWQFDRLLATEDSRLIAAHWIEQQFPRGAIVAETSRRFDRLSFPAHSQYVSIALEAETPDPDAIVLSESPLHPGGLGEELSEAQKQRYAKALETSAPERPGAVYDWQDEFYIPLAGIDHLERPGPRLTVLTRR